MADVFVELSAASQEPPVGTLVGDASAGRWGGFVVFAYAGRLKGRDKKKAGWFESVHLCPLGIHSNSTT